MVVAGRGFLETLGVEAGRFSSLSREASVKIPCIGTSAHHTFDTNRNFARAELLWFVRHAQTLVNWPILPEPWAEAIERKRIEAESPDRHDETYFHGKR
jgi:hypothetical protein